MGKDTCDKCIHCDHITYDQYYFCEVHNEYIGVKFALDETLDCDCFVEKLDDHEAEEHSA